jgi:hypothetical protein
MWRKWGRKVGFLILGFSDFEICFGLNFPITPQIPKSQNPGISKFLTLPLRHAQVEHG